MTRDITIDIQDALPQGSAGFERCQRLRDRVIQVEPYFCTERAVLLTESYKQTEGEHMMLRRAKALDHILRNMKVYILSDELIVGHQAPKQRSGNVFPEYAVQWIYDEIDEFETRPADKFILSDEDRRVFMEELYPYWKGRTLHDRMMAMIPEDTKLQRFDAMVFAIGHHETGGFGHVVIDHERILQKGFKGIRTEIEQKLAEMRLDESNAWKRKIFYDSCLIIIDAIIAFAHRYADLAVQMAGEETDEGRRKELLAIADNCRYIPENPPATFWQACQVVWFNQLILQINDNGTSYTPGRFDQYMFPFYAQDLGRGAPKAQLQEVLEAFWIKLTEPVKLFAGADSIINVGQPTGQNISIGGLSPEGEDATNDLSYRCLEASLHLRLMQPNFTVRMHKGTPQSLLMRAIEAIKMGSGMPQLTNDHTFTEAMLKLGVSLEDAREYVPVGCMETMPKNTWGRANGGFLNLTKVLELALSDGRCRITGKQVGPKTGDARTFTSMEQIKEAYEKQMAHSVTHNAIENNLIDLVHEEIAPIPLVSLFVDNCVERGVDATSGGAKYNWTSVLGIGVANAGDALMGIQQAVFDEKLVTMEELIDALDNDFEGNEPLRQYLLNRVPKYGNDLPEVDGYVRYATDVFFDELARHRSYLGGPFVGSLISISAYVPFGEKTGATPDGRLSGSAIADSISPMNGVDLNGPTAAMKSALAIDHTRCGNGLIFNQKFTPGPLQSKEGMEKFASLIRSYINLGGAQIQFNIVDGDTLRAAKADPQKYRGLVVRVAGYSAFFHELCEDIQDTIIARTEYSV
ncbi:glycyl radical protein [Ruminococcaceae bacterium OttesenSCG-928-I18]|nr:glycyl radical protein [Ruminococcaceae bacterium OttesenSCG-928-I18]